MSTIRIPRPASNEAAPFYHRYTTKVTGENIGEQLLQQLDRVERLFRGVDDDAACFRYAPGKWSIKEVLGHLTDAERIFAYRLLRIARGDTTPLAGFDENAYVPTGAFDERPIGSLVREFRAVRVSTMALIEGLPPAAWERAGQASDNRVSSRALAYILVGHVTHHLGVLEERYGVGPETGATARA